MWKSVLMPMSTTNSRMAEAWFFGVEKGVVPHCPPEKEEAIRDALRHFGMI